MNADGGVSAAPTVLVDTLGFWVISPIQPGTLESFTLPSQ